MSDSTWLRLLVPGLTALLLGITLAGVLAGPAGAPDRAAELERRLRCPVCTSVSIAESPSEAAAVARQVVREQVNAGRSDQQVLQYFQARYGEWILLDPEPAGRNLLLFALPAAAAGGGVVLIASRRQSVAPPASVPDDLRQQIESRLQSVRSRRFEEEDAP